MLDEKAIADLEEKLARATPSPWDWWTSCSFRRLTGPDGKSGSVAHAYIAPDGVPDIAINSENMALIQDLRNAAPDLLALASFGLKAKAFLEEHANTADEAFMQSAAAWQKRLNAKEVGLHANARFALSQLLDSARALAEAKGGK